MEPVLETVAIERINPDDTTFAMRCAGPAADLYASLDANGILTPLTVHHGPTGRFTLVDGHRRCAWARAGGYSTIPCLVYPAATEAALLWRLRLEAKLFGPELNPAEKAQVLARYAALVDPAELHRRVLPRLGIHTGAGSLEKWQRLAAAEDDFLNLLADGLIAERAALELVDWPTAARLRMLGMLRELRPSASIQVEILETVWEIARRERLEPLAVLEQAPVKRVLAAADHNHRQKTQALRDLLFQLRFPRLSARTARVQELLAAAGLPPTLRVRPPRSFEGGTWSLELVFSRVRELQRDLETARAFAASGRLEGAMTMPEPAPCAALAGGGANADGAA
ncbi:MAG: hypothetical protein COT06_06095 [Syntrophobacteraceae bacterium CG07_land_8_20_14_0_80_61_8]|nr:MAG: hypothetical protein COT06_06095 [Syntrophobacteraceae bacterium CG07_land_8_20_14_0_80_61_8]